MTSDQALAHVIDRLERGGVGYLLVGALSSNLYGVPRATDDADVEVSISCRSRRGWVTSFGSIGR